MSCHSEACTFEGAGRAEVTTYDYTFPGTVLHIRTKATIEFDQLFVAVSSEMRAKLESLDVKVNGVATTRLEPEPDHPERLRFAIPRVREGEGVEVQMSSPESVTFRLGFVDATATCRMPRGL